MQREDGVARASADGSKANSERNPGAIQLSGGQGSREATVCIRKLTFMSGSCHGWRPYPRRLPTPGGFASVAWHESDPGSTSWRRASGQDPLTGRDMGHRLSKPRARPIGSLTSAA